MVKHYAAAWNYDPKAHLRELIYHLITLPGPASIDDLPAEKNADGLVIVVDAKVVDDLNVAAGKEDLRSFAETLFDALDGIPDAGERHRAYDALHRVTNAIFLIAKSGFDPFSGVAPPEQASGCGAGAKQQEVRRARQVCSVRGREVQEQQAASVDGKRVGPRQGRARQK